VISKRQERALYGAVGRRVKELRSGRFTQEELAKIVSLSRTSITNLEKGRQRAPLHQLLQIADAMGRELADLMPTRAELGIRDDLGPRGRDLEVVGNLTPATRAVLSRVVTKGSDDVE
jgi:transcriptional regulator with XRE-family HTH domain